MLISNKGFPLFTMMRFKHLKLPDKQKFFLFSHMVKYRISVLQLVKEIGESLSDILEPIV